MRIGPVQQQEVDFGHTEPYQALLGRSFEIIWREVVGPDLGGHENGIAPHAGSAQAVAHLALVLIGLRSIEMAIAEPQRLLNNAGAGAPAQFPCAQADRGDFGAVGFDKMHGCALWLRVALCRAGSVLPTATPITRPARPGQLLARAAKTVSGACAITASSARAGPRGARLPCSQFRMVSTGTPRRAANSCWVSRARRRRSRTSRVPPSADMPKASGASGNSRPSRNSTIRPSAFSRKRCIVATLTRDAQSSAKPVKARLTINPLTGLTLFQPEPEGCDSEEGEEADHVSDRRDKGSRGDRRIGPQLFQHNRNQDAAERPSHEVADD